MTAPQDIEVYFNFRSPYCYLASKRMWVIFDDYHTTMVWKPFGGWSGRSDPDRAKRKIPSVRQDVSRWARRMGIPFTPPPITTDPTRAGAGSLLAEERGVLREYVIDMMRAEWAEGKDIGDVGVVLEVGERVGLDRDQLVEEIDHPDRLAVLERNWQEAQEKSIFGVPSFFVGDEVFWGNDRIEFLTEHLRELRLARL